MIKKGEINMSRYTGPSWKISRRLGYSILENGKELKKRTYGPGPHAKDKRKKNSEYGKQLIEKQKLRETYGVSERQFQKLFLKAKSTKGVVTGVYFMQLLESRLDNVVYRLGFAATRRQARQLVNHGHITVDGKRVDIPSYEVSVGQTIGLKEKSKNLQQVKDALDAVTARPSFVSFDDNKMEGSLVRLPERDEMEPEIDESLVVEYYNKLL